MLIHGPFDSDMGPPHFGSVSSLCDWSEIRPEIRRDYSGTLQFITPEPRSAADISRDELGLYTTQAFAACLTAASTFVMILYKDFGVEDWSEQAGALGQVKI